MTRHLSARRIFRCFAALALAWSCSSAFAADAPVTAGSPTVTMHTNMGDIVLELYPDKAPLTVANFLKYVKDGHYDGTLFHRVVKGTLIQGGGFDKKLHEKHLRPPIKNEANNGLSNKPYMVAMARARAPDSAAAQFYINTDDNSELDYPSSDGAGYCVFAKVIDGMETLDKIQQVETVARGDFDHLPTTAVVIESARINK
jgi:peptidyl-prolyl cis-trans isomerase A (cyclophilin A)